MNKSIFIPGRLVRITIGFPNELKHQVPTPDLIKGKSQIPSIGSCILSLIKSRVVSCLQIHRDFHFAPISCILHLASCILKFGSWLLGFVTWCLALGAWVFAQEVLSPLEVNPQLLQKKTPLYLLKSEKNNNSNISLLPYFLIDTIQMDSLPQGFVDDFSTNKQKNYNLKNLTFDFLHYTFSVNNEFLDSIAYMSDTSYQYFFDTANQITDSFPKNPFEIIIYYDETSPFYAYDTLTVWPEYYTYTFDSATGNPIDSTLIPPLIIYQKYKNITVHYFSVNNSFPDTIRYMTDTSWNFSYNTITHTIDSTPKNPFYIVFYDTANYPFNIYDSIKVWPEYYTYEFDTITGEPIDSTLVAPDNILVQKIFVYFLIPDDTNSLWIDNYAYINNNYPIEPITVGVATFDGIDERGMPYNFANQSAYGVADYLTSKPINLSYSAADSVYISFYYQPQGRGDDPQPKDSLVLEFYSVDDKLWNHVWSIKGDETHNFKLVMVPISATKFLKNGFQFRFKNYATLSGNLDHWHIDYVYLNKNRTFSDTVLIDVAFVNQPPSFLKNYQAIPYNHFKHDSASAMIPEIPFYIHNNRQEIANTNYLYQIKNDTGIIFEYFVGTYNIDSADYFDTLAPVNNSPANFTFPIYSSDSALFEIIHCLTSNPDNRKENDTIRFQQRFYNYYAYDDGSAEAGYYINAVNGQVAYKFTINQADTIRGVQMYWTPVIYDVSHKCFYLTLWNDNGGVPGDIIYQKQECENPAYTDNINEFSYYFLDEIVVVNGTFYVGWEQPTNDKLNIGFDRNIDASDNIFYKTNGIWNITQYSGALMIRPLFGDTVVEPINIKEIVENHISLKVYPNPASDKLFMVPSSEFRVPSSENLPANASQPATSNQQLIISIYDIFGKTVYNTTKYERMIDVSFLNQGIYLLQIFIPDRQEYFNEKVIIIR